MSIFSLLTVFLPSGLVLIGGILTVKILNQHERDNRRTTYLLNFPSDLDPERVLAFLRATSRTLHSSTLNLTASQTMVFETLATASGITHRLKVPWQKEDDIISQLRALAPGVSASPDTTYPKITWTYGVEIGSTNKGRPYTIPNPQDTATSILASLQPLTDGEAILLQWVVTPAAAQRLPEPGKSAEFSWFGKQASDEVSERRAKLSEPNVMGVLRVASRSKTMPRAKHLIDRIKTSYNATATTSNHWYRRTTSASGVIDRAATAASLSIWPAQLSVSEMVALIGWPIGSPNVSGLPQGTARQLPVSARVPVGDIVIGHATFPGQERNVGIAFDQALMHTWIGGSTGVGKSTLMAHMARHIMNAGHGLIVMETEGNLFESVTDYVPRERINDVVVLDLSDTQMPLGFNPLDQGNPDSTIDSLIELFEHLYGVGLWADEYITHGLKTLAEVGNLSFLDVVPLLNPQTKDEIRWADEIARKVKDPDLRRWWDQHDNRGKLEQQKRADPMLSRIGKLTARKELRNVFGQRTSSFQMADIFRENKILLINLKGTSSGTSKLVGTLMMNAIWRATRSTYKERPTYVMLDEFSAFMDLPINTESMLAQARKHNVGLILANQHMSQLTPEVRDGVITNARNKIVLATSPDDARTILKGMNSKLAVTDITNLRAYEAMADVMTPTGNSGPFSLGTKPPARPTGYGNAAVARSRAVYGRPVGKVVQDMYEHKESRTDDAERPRETGDGWD